MYSDPCVICSEFCNPYTSNPRLATGAMTYFPNVDRLNNVSRSSTFIICHKCLAKFESITGKPMPIEYNELVNQCQCRGLISDPALPTGRTGHGIELYLGVATAINRDLHKMYAPLSFDDFRRFIQIKMTGDWTGTNIYEFVSGTARSWLEVDFVELAHIFWNLYTFKKPKDVARVIVRYGCREGYYPSYERIKTEKSIKDDFIVLISTDEDSSNRSALSLSNSVQTEYREVLADFDMDITQARKFFKVGGQLVSGGTYLSNPSGQFINDLLVTRSVEVTFAGNIGCQRIRSKGDIRYET